MPVAIGAFLAGIFGATVSAATAAMIGWTVISTAASIVIGQVSKLFHKQPSSSSLSSYNGRVSVTARQAVAPRLVAYGHVRIGGIITFLAASGLNNQLLHIVITLTGHEVNAIGGSASAPANMNMYFDGVAVPLDASGNCTSGPFAGLVHAEFNPGSRDQQAFPGLVAANVGWDNTCRQRGCAGVYVQLTWNQTAFPNGLPNITFDVNGRDQVYDPRSGTMGYSNNAALCIADYLNNPVWGLHAQTQWLFVGGQLANSGMGNFTAANACDGNVAVGSKAWDTNTAAAGSTVTLDLGSGSSAEFRRARLYMDGAGCKAIYNVQYSDDGLSWTNAAITLSCDCVGWNDWELAPNGAHRYWRPQLQNAPGAGPNVTEWEMWFSDVDSTTLATAANTCDELVAVATGDTDSYGNVITQETRYQCNGSFTTDQAPSDILTRLNSAIAGSCVYLGGKWGIYPGTWRGVSLNLTDADLRAPLVVQTRRSHRDIFNSVKGQFFSPAQAWALADFPPYSDPTWVNEDGNEIIWQNVEYPFTTSPAACQRISKISLERIRRQITSTAQFKLTAYQVQPMDIVQFSHPFYGWVNKTFEVASCSLIYDDSQQQTTKRQSKRNDPMGSGPMAVGVNLVLNEVDSTIYNWSVTEENSFNVPPQAVLPSNSSAGSPTNLVLSSAEIIRAIDGTRIAAIQVTWTAPLDQFVQSGGQIVIQYKKHTSIAWITNDIVPGNTNTDLIAPVVDGTQYDVQIYAVNPSGVASAVVSSTIIPTATPTPTAYGKNMTCNAGFEQNGVGTPFNQNLALGDSVGDGWLIYDLPTRGIVQIVNTFARSGKNSCVIGIDAGVSVPANSLVQGGVRSIYETQLAVGDIIRVSCWFNPNGSPTPGLNYYFQIAALVYDNAGNLLGLAGFQQAVNPLGGWQFIQGSMQIPATLGGGVPAFAVVAFISGQSNPSGSPITTTAAVYEYVDDIKLIIQNTAFDLTPINTSGTFLGGSPCSQSGTSTAINVAAATMQFGDGQVSYGAGSVDPGSYGTWYIYADDPTYSGGTVTYYATANQSDVYGSNGRIFFGAITTAGGGGAVSVNGGAGGGKIGLKA